MSFAWMDEGFEKLCSGVGPPDLFAASEHTTRLFAWKEKQLQKELMKVKTHRMNVELNDYGMKMYRRGDNVTWEWMFSLTRIKPEGWRAPLP